jgi:hypothetical protein
VKIDLREPVGGSEFRSRFGDRISLIKETGIVLEP